MKEVKLSLSQNLGFLVAFIGLFTCKMVAVGCSLYGSIIMSEQFKDQNEGKDYISLLFTIGNILVIPFSLVIGYLSDRHHMWKLILIVNVLNLGFLFMYIFNISSPNFWQGMGFVMVFSLHVITFVQVIELVNLFRLKFSSTN